MESELGIFVIGTEKWSLFLALTPEMVRSSELPRRLIKLLSKTTGANYSKSPTCKPSTCKLSKM